MSEPIEGTGAPARAPAAGPPPIRTRALTKRYERLTAVDQLTLEIQAGEIFGLLGQNGAGKTTTILMLLGLSEPSSGQARVLGLDPARHPLEVKRRVGYLPDAVGFYGDLTGRQNLRYTARLNGLRGDSAEATIEASLDQVGMTDRADDRTETYSRGMLQRLGIADALVKDPEVLILDEPTTSIDPIGVVEILELLRRLSAERGMTILLSSHLLSQVQSVCDRVGIFAAGKLIGLGTVPELAERFGTGRAQIEATFEAGVDTDRIRTTLGAIEGVVAVSQGTGLSRPWIVEIEPPSAAEGARREILARAVGAGLNPTGLRAIEASLDEIYRTAAQRREAA